MASSKCAQHLIETRSDAISTTRFEHTIVTEPPIARRQSCFIWLALVHHQRLHRMELMKKQTISIFVRKKSHSLDGMRCGDDNDWLRSNWIQHIHHYSRKWKKGSRRKEFVVFAARQLCDALRSPLHRCRDVHGHTILDFYLFMFLCVRERIARWFLVMNELTSSRVYK